jgi:hypothetical protein
MEIHHADKAYRTRSLWLLLAIVLMCALLLWQLQSWLDSLTSQLYGSDPRVVREWVRLLLVGLGFALALPAIGLSMALRRLAAAANDEGRFPPSGLKTLRDVRVLRGPAAQAWARRVLLGSRGALGLAAVLLAWAGWAWWYFR